MFYIKTLTVSSYDFQSATLEWEYTNPKANTNGHHLEIYRSETPAPVTAFSGIAMDVSPTAYSYTDTTISGINLHQFHTWYYRIKVVDTDTPTTYEWSNPAHIEVTPDALAKRMLKVKNVGIKKYGTLVKVLKKRAEQGVQCSCFDVTLQRSMDDECELCNGTGIQTTGGYYDPLDVYVAINTRPKQNEITPFGVWQQNDALMDMLNYPVLAPDDLIVDQQNKRYKVKQIATYDKGQSLISQRCVISLQEKSSQVYGVTIE
ncbi:MAG: hypothetical protein H8D23_12870 [Candidatus Brocadiales bacterium]|nr:hypothetical protein [Candidatus Brocadiales bacterium]